MATSTPTVAATLRDRLGTRYTRRLRAQGMLPVVIYGHGEKPISAAVNAKEILGHLHHGSHVITVSLGGSNETCLVKELQFGYLGDEVIHIDFARVNLDEVVRVNVRIEFFGECAASKKPGAVLTHDLAELAIHCKVRDIPESVRADLSAMQGDMLNAGELKLPAGITLAIDPHAPVARVITIAEEKAGEAAAPAADAAAPAADAKKEGEGDAAKAAAPKK
ncbi:MAG: 50S ribosomal protein L25 [Phycisphaerae bacterium]|nr:50S ribosomal protein L25 [Phycisphaerae bacterium]